MRTRRVERIYPAATSSRHTASNRRIVCAPYASLLLRVRDLEVAKSFYTDYLGPSIEEFNLGWVARYTSPGTRASVQLVTRDAAAPETPVISVLTEDVDGAYAEAQQLGYEILYPLTTDRWGVRRFFVRAPDGTTINIVRHHG